MCWLNRSQVFKIVFYQTGSVFKLDNKSITRGRSWKLKTTRGENMLTTTEQSTLVAKPVPLGWPCTVSYLPHGYDWIMSQRFFYNIWNVIDVDVNWVFLAVPLLIKKVLPRIHGPTGQCWYHFCRARHQLIPQDHSHGASASHGRCVYFPARAGTVTNPRRMEGWINVVGWFHTEMVFPSEDGHPSQY